MTNQLINTYVSLMTKPCTDLPLAKDKQVTIGDLHGNALKLLFLLVKHGVIVNISDEIYLELANIYIKNIDYINSDDLKRFDEILDSLTFQSDGLIRLIGDELCDRGQNDYYTLKILDKLHQNNVAVEIVMSNHAIEFINAYETKQKFFPFVMDNLFTQSMINMQILIAKNLLTRNEVMEIVKRSYKPCLRAISYTLVDDEITLYSHAPIDIRAVRFLARRLKVEYDDSSVQALASSIDKINEAYRTYVKYNTVHTLYDKEVMHNGYTGVEFPAMFNPFEYIMWNRDLSHLNNAPVYKGYKVYFVHGHDNQTSMLDNVINLDNILGKSLKLLDGEYTVLMTSLMKIDNKNQNRIDLATASATL